MLIGALLYFPVILNVCILAHAVRFEGTRTTTFMLLANLFLLCWDYERLKAGYQVLTASLRSPGTEKKRLRSKFPFAFLLSVFATLAPVVIVNLYLYDIRPGNAPDECINQCPGNGNPKACEEFCDCIYREGNTLRKCLADYHAATMADDDKP